MRPSFAPLDDDAIDFLSEETDIDFRRIDFSQPQWFCGTARRDDGTIRAILACEFKNPFDVHFSAAISDPSAITRRLLGAIFTALFARAVRVTALVSPDNERAIKTTRRLGFVYEGFMRKGVEGRRDALLFGMLREDCRWLPGYRARPIQSFFPLGESRHGLQS